MAKVDLAAGDQPRSENSSSELESLPPAELVARIRALDAAVADKEAALRELQHRAKNSLQLVISLLRLQHHRITDPVARAAYDQTMFRVEVLAILYRQVHEARSETQVNLARYLREVCETAIANVGDVPVPVTLSVEAEPLTTSLYTAMPLGLIANELVMQGLHHAYPEDAWMRVRLEQLPSGSAKLTVADNGRGLPQGFDADADAASMLVEALATQLGADLDLSHGSGTAVHLTLKL